MQEWISGLSKRQQSAWFGVIYAGLLGCMVTLYGLAAGKFPGGVIPGLLSVPITFYIAGKLMERRESGPQPIEIPELTELLVSLGAKKPQLSILRGKDNREFPRPFVFGEAISISEVALASLSRPALHWFLRTEYLSQKRLMRKMGKSGLVLALVVMPVLGLMERFKVPGWWMLGIVAMFVVYFTAGFRVQALEQIRADSEITTTVADLPAAKEALSYPYFSQLRRKRGKRFLFSLKEMERRARCLDISLEEGYRVPGAERTRFGADELDG